MAVTDRGGRAAVTHWEVLERFQGFTHVRCRLETGRTHQIRVHMAHLGHPICGDTVYGARKPVPGLTGQCLHAVGLRFIHPRTGEAVELSCPLSDAFTALLEKLRKWEYKNNIPGLPRSGPGMFLPVSLMPGFVSWGWARMCRTGESRLRDRGDPLLRDRADLHFSAGYSILFR